MVVHVAFNPASARNADGGFRGCPKPPAAPPKAAGR
jgi:hypothetical protein